MSKDLLKSAAILLLMSLFGFVLNKAILYLINSKVEYHYALVQYYILFTIVAFGVTTFLTFIKKKEIAYVGYSFLWLTLAQMIICAILINTILFDLSKTERTNFFILCLYFLAIETILGIKILNKPQPKNKSNKNQ